jgi:hypothetical protein
VSPEIWAGPAGSRGDDIGAEAARLAAAALAGRLQVRLMGGVAIWLTSPSVRRPPYERGYRDLDFVAASRDRRALATLLDSMGYLPDRLFNALHGARRLNFAHPDGRWAIDVIFDELRMSHRIDLRGRLEGAQPTLDMADLLLTKLQIWEINLKDVGDAVCLLADHALSNAATGPTSESIDLARITALCSADWGLARTVDRNLGKVIDQARAAPPVGASLDAAAAGATLRGAIEAVPKTLGWRARARLGERIRWYETPEEVGRRPASHDKAGVDQAPERDP